MLSTLIIQDSIMIQDSSLSQEDKDNLIKTIHGSGLDTGTKGNVQFSRGRLGQKSSTGSENTTQRTENLGRPKEE